MKKVKNRFANRLLLLCGILAAILVVFVIGSMPDLLTGAAHVSFASAAIIALTGINLSAKSPQELKELRGAKFEELENILKGAETEKRDLKDDEISKRDDLLKALDKLDSEIRAKEDIETKRKQYANTQATREKGEGENRELASYSFVKAIREYVQNSGKLTGLEAEMNQEATREAKESGIGISGIGVPSIILKRDLTATGQTTTAGDQGGTMIPTIKLGFIDVLRARMVLAQLGAQFLTGLSGNVSIPKKTTAASATWANGENVDATAGAALFGSVELTPKRLAAFTQISKQLMVQSSQDVENLVVNDLEMAVRLAVEAAAINGTGLLGQPKGILGVTGIGSVVGGADGLAPTLAHIISLESEVAIDNADIGSLGYLTNQKVRGKLKTTPKVANYPEYIWGTDKAAPLNGYNAAVTSQVPSNLAKGGSGAVCSAILFGNFNDLIVAQWAGLDLVVDPYTRAKQNEIAITINSFWDIAVRHAESFAAMVDALTA
jgi:HK97 family phage major capsid protein